MTKKKKSAAGDIDFRTTKYPDYADGYFICVEIDLNDHIDWYAYHDAPSSVDFQLTLDELRLIKAKIDKAISDAEKIVANKT